ncbi:MAG: crotonase/enoyl-CoA hydratase family protein [Myxococcota bacterium]|nr:crotonase/enoyl-CoA hydratase family protein [Myxococcota bacterium]
MKTETPVLYEPTGAIVRISIHRPYRKNAVDGPTAAALYDAFRHFEMDRTLKVAILAGSGDSFCSGADLKAIDKSNHNPLHLFESAQGEMSPMGPTRMNFKKPIIAAIQGYAVAGGLELALMCDLRVADENAKFGVFCRRWGVPLIDGGTVRLPRLIGMSRALDMILTGREVSAQEAKEIGLINYLTPAGDALLKAEAIAQELIKVPQNCLLHDRQSVYEQSGLSFNQALKNEFELGLKTLETGEPGKGATTYNLLRQKS